MKSLGREDKPWEGDQTRKFACLSRSSTEIFTIVGADFSLLCFSPYRNSRQEIRYRAARLRSKACLMPLCIDPRKERARLFSADSYIMRLHPLDKHYDWFACLHNAPDYRLPWKPTKLVDLMGQRKFNIVNIYGNQKYFYSFRVKYEYFTINFMLKQHEKFAKKILYSCIIPVKLTSKSCHNSNINLLMSLTDSETWMFDEQFTKRSRKIS